MTAWSEARQTLSTSAKRYAPSAASFVDWIETAEKRRAAGKQVVFSTLALVEAQSEIGYIRRLCESGDYLVEANDMSAVQILAGRAPFVGGPSLNINNQRSLARLAELGLTRWVAPVEMTATMYDAIREATKATIEYELLVWGRLPLAWSARCYTARAYDRNKDDCENCCIEHPGGLGLETRDGDGFLVVNGIQTMSAKTYCRFGTAVDDSNADLWRVSPQPRGTAAVLETLDALRHGKLEPAAAHGVFTAEAHGGLCDGYWHGMAGMTSASGGAAS